MSLAKDQVEFNIAAHNELAEKYDDLHGEIFNDIEQKRLASALSQAASHRRSAKNAPRAFDFGCGSGNLTRHLLNMEFEVVAADVTPRLLEIVEERFRTPRLTTLRLNGTDLGNVPDGSFDFVATYSVLHHVPDYIAAVKEMARICAPGGIVYIDHERTAAYWSDSDPILAEFAKRAPRPNPRKYLRPANYLHRVRRFFNPRYAAEGDIHVWADDHIEWGLIQDALQSANFDLIIDERYLLFRREYRREIYREYSDRCSDTQMMAFRKRTAAAVS